MCPFNQTFVYLSVTIVQLHHKYLHTTTRNGSKLPHSSVYFGRKSVKIRTGVSTLPMSGYHAGLCRAFYL